MPVILEPEYRRVQCDTCHAWIGFQSGEIERCQWADRIGTFTVERVKCPRCIRGYGLVASSSSHRTCRW